MTKFGHKGQDCITGNILIGARQWTSSVKGVVTGLLA